MYEYYKYNKDECIEVSYIIEKAKNIWIKNLPPRFQGSLIEEFEEILEYMFESDGEIGKISYEMAVRDVVIPAVEVVFDNLKDKKLESLLSKFVLDVDGSTLYDALKSKIEERERQEQLKKSYSTKEEAVKNGIENPSEYHCWECGKTFWAEWRSNYSPAATCPFCYTENR